MKPQVPPAAIKRAILHQNEAEWLARQARHFLSLGMKNTAQHYQVRSANEAFCARWLLRIE